jgi:DNA-binding XRE family transcriptional regulator
MKSIKQLREAAGLTTVELARKAKVCRKTLWNAEKGKQVKQSTLSRIYEAVRRNPKNN